MERKQKIMMERSLLECFLFSSRFEMMTDVNPSTLILQCKKTAVEIEKKKRNCIIKMIEGKELRK